MEEWLVTLATIPRVVGSIPTRDKHLCDEHLYLCCVWVWIIVFKYVFKNIYASVSDTHSTSS